MALYLIALALLVSAFLIWRAGADWRLMAGVIIGTMVSAALIHLIYRYRGNTEEDAQLPPDWGVTRLALDQVKHAVAISDRAGRLTCANELFGKWFDGLRPPPDINVDTESRKNLADMARLAWRDGKAERVDIMRGAARYSACVEIGGSGERYLVWSFFRVEHSDLAAEADQLVSGQLGRALSRHFIMALTINKDGRIASANSAFARRAVGDDNANLVGRDLSRLLNADPKGHIYFAREGERALPVRLLHVPLNTVTKTMKRADEDMPALVMIVDDETQLASGDARAMMESLIARLPMGLAAVDRDGRFLFANDNFRKIADLGETLPPYPGDLVVKEDKAALGDAIRRYANGPAHSGDIALRLKDAPDDVVSMTLSGLRGAGEAAVLLALKDNSEESRLKRQVAQATKMQAVGQLAGGVAHDFNNILTAILGICDLMLLRYSPGDSDYDDVQQIKNNGNRAANLTRQLLAFSRQQTLRPQIVQLPDIVSDTSSMLKRLMGEKVALDVRHARGIGAVRADPGQLGQVVMNLAVNARDAMPAGGRVQIETGPVTAAQVRDMQSDILPVADYARLTVSDTGEGIPKDVLGKIFEPFFTTKPMGKGTGLGLSTVYGIVKQSGGFIFVNNQETGGARFDVYLPVHRGEPEALEAAAVPEPPKQLGESWGTGTILLVEDEDMVRAVAERALTRAGYKVETAEDGEIAVDMLRNGRDYDLILSDVVMPNMDGPAMGRLAREMRPGIPIIFMSGYAEEQLRNSIDLKDIGFVPKPFTVAQIAQVVGDRLARK